MANPFSAPSNVLYEIHTASAIAPSHNDGIDTDAGLEASLPKQGDYFEWDDRHRPAFYHQPKHGGIMTERPATFPRMVTREEFDEIFN